MEEAEPATRDALLARAATYAREEVDLDLDVGSIRWEISERARRRAGACRYDAATGEITISLTWRAYRAFGWERFAGTIRHELVHAWEFERFGESGHGRRFEEKAAEIDAPRYCGEFAAPRFRLRCADAACDWEAARYRASKTVRRPSDPYRCGSCAGEYVVEHVRSGERWSTPDGYEAARERIPDDVW